MSLMPVWSGETSSFPEKSLAEAGRTSLRHGEQMLKRVETTGTVPDFGVSLDAGRMSGEHVDAMGRALRQLEPGQRQLLIAQADRLVILAENATPDEFSRTLRAEARRMESDGHGLESLARQRRAGRFSSWVDTPRRPNHDHRTTRRDAA